MSFTSTFWWITICYLADGLIILSYQYLMESDSPVWITICYSLLMIDFILSILVQKGRYNKKHVNHSTSIVWCSLTLFWKWYLWSSMLVGKARWTANADLKLENCVFFLLSMLPFFFSLILRLRWFKEKNNQNIVLF